EGIAVRSGWRRQSGRRSNAVNSTDVLLNVATPNESKQKVRTMPYYVHVITGTGRTFAHHATPFESLEGCRFDVIQRHRSGAEAVQAIKARDLRPGKVSAEKI